MAEQPRFSYGGQAVIEGVMIRGKAHFSLAVRCQDGSITHRHELLNPLYSGRIRRVPLVRGGLALAETLMLGVKALHQSASLAMRDQLSDQEEEIPGWVLGATMVVSLALGIGVFFLLPLLAVRVMDPAIASDLVSNIIEGVLRLVVLVVYVWGIGFLRDIKRVFAYHGAEHMVVHNYEAGLPLDVANARKYRPPHPPVRYSVLAGGNASLHPGIFLPGASADRVADTVADRADSSNRWHQLRNHPV